LSFEHKPGGATLTSELTSGPAAAPTPGRRTLTQDMVQMKIKAGTPAAGEQVKTAAAEGVSGSAGALPFLSLIQKAFGRHDVSSVRAHTDGAAAAGARAMGAEAYASGSSVAFGAAPDLHTAAHEAAHIVQQRSALVLAGGVGAAGDEHERNADAVADRVVAGQSAEDLLDRYTGGGSSAPVVQQKIKTTAGGKPTMYVTWRSIKAPKFTQAQIDASRAVREEFRAELLATGVVMDDERFETVWNKIQGEGDDASAFDIDDTAGRAALLTELHKRYASSSKSAEQYGRNQRDIDILIDPILKAHPDHEKKPSARNTMMVKTPMGKAPARKPKTPEDRAQQAQTHLSTVTHHTYSGSGEESQSAIQKDKLGLITSTNNDGTNALLAQDAQSRDDLRDMAARLAVALGIGTMTREAAMANRVMRHALKLISRIEKTLDAKVEITVPGKSKSGQDGVHAEIRIYQHDDFDASTHHMPSGTKVPCAGCYLYFVAEGNALGVYMGPMWLTEAALSQQLKLAKIGTIDGSNAGELAKIATEIKKQYEDALKHGGHMVESWVRGDEYTTQTNADSESDLDDDEFKEAQQAALVHGSTKPRSGKMPTNGKPKQASKAKASTAPKKAKQPAATKKKAVHSGPPLSTFGFGAPVVYSTPLHGGHSHPPPPTMHTGGSSVPPPFMPPWMMGMPPMGMGMPPMGMGMPPMGMGMPPMGMGMPPMGMGMPQHPPTMSPIGIPSTPQLSSLPTQATTPAPMQAQLASPQVTTPPVFKLSTPSPLVDPSTLSPLQPQLSSPQLATPSPVFHPPTPSPLHSQPSSPHLSTPSSPQPSTPVFDPFAPSQSSPVTSTPSSPQLPSPQLSAPSSSSSNPVIQQLVVGMMSALSQPPPPLDPGLVLGGQLSFMDTVAPSGIGNVVDLHNASGAANNCLINSIAGALGMPPVSLLTLALIRQECGGEAGRFLGRDDVPTILRHLRSSARVVLIETVDVIGDGTTPFQAVVIPGAGPEIYIVNAHDLHFGWCEPKPGFQAVVGVKTVTFAPTAASQSPVSTPPLAFHFGSGGSPPPEKSLSRTSSGIRDNRDFDDFDNFDDLMWRSSPPRSSPKPPVWPHASSSNHPSLRRASSSDLDDELGLRKNPAKRPLPESPPPPLMRAATDLVVRPNKMQRGSGMRGGLSRSSSMRGGSFGGPSTSFGLPTAKKRVEIDLSLEEQDEELLPDDDVFMPAPKRQDRKSDEDEDEDGGSSFGGFGGWFDSQQ
jgi:hypothetical protein